TAPAAAPPPARPASPPQTPPSQPPPPRRTLLVMARSPPDTPHPPTCRIFGALDRHVPPQTSERLLMSALLPAGRHVPQARNGDPVPRTPGPNSDHAQ